MTKIKMEAYEFSNFIVVFLIFICVYTHTHTHTYIYIYVYMYIYIRDYEGQNSEIMWEGG